MPVREYPHWAEMARPRVLAVFSHWLGTGWEEQAHDRSSNNAEDLEGTEAGG